MLDILQNFNPNLTQCQLNTLEKFKKLLLFYNKQFNLTSIEDDTGFYIKHLIDSLFGESFFEGGAKVIEIGSGGGFPSMPVKIVRDDLDFTLVESVGKKCTFLNTAIKELELNNIKVLNTRAEDAAKDKNYREKFDAVCARAVAPLNTLCEYCAPFIKIGGKFIAYKTYSESEIKDSERAQKLLGLKLSQTFPYELPLGFGKRSILVFEKIAHTPDIYPRGNGKERSKPL